MQDMSPDTNKAIANFNGAAALFCLATGFVPGAILSGIACIGNASIATFKRQRSETVAFMVPRIPDANFRTGALFDKKF